MTLKRPLVIQKKTLRKHCPHLGHRQFRGQLGWFAPRMQAQWGQNEGSASKNELFEAKSVKTKEQLTQFGAFSI